MIESIQIYNTGYCAYKHYDNFIIGKYSERIMRHRKQDIAFLGFLVGKNGFNPYSFIQGCTLQEFLTNKTIITQSVYLGFMMRVRILHQSIVAILNVMLNDCKVSSEEAYISKNECGQYTIGKQNGPLSYETIFISCREDGIAMKIKKHDVFGGMKFHDEETLTSIQVSVYEGIKSSIITQATDMFSDIAKL